ncbi:MAG: hypothetical protein HW417_943 [Steroidobacteraceae bacterium]|jgi:hypothetical protein|nr:hypothetical protein [Steroidobacteraceae bacterium]MBM2854015.1 hypothetical protein [Steroidobacteraceae bacterium]
MGPLGFLTGVVLGSAASIALVLAMVVVIFALSSGTQAAIGAEYPSLLATAGLFTVLAGIAGAAFAGLQRQKPWRWHAQAIMWLTLAMLGWHYWPQGNA